MDEGTAVRAGKERGSFDPVIAQYDNGMTPEDLVRAYRLFLAAQSGPPPA